MVRSNKLIILVENSFNLDFVREDYYYKSIKTMKRTMILILYREMMAGENHQGNLSIHLGVKLILSGSSRYVLQVVDVSRETLTIRVATRGIVPF